MKAKTIIPIVSSLLILGLIIAGCQLTTTLVVEEYEDYDVRFVNRSGERVKVRWDGDNYHYLDENSVISIPMDGGYYELEWENASSRSKRPKQIFSITIEADIDIVFRDDPDIIIIDR